MSDPIVTFDENAVRGELRELVRRTVEDTLNALLEEEADDLIGADRYERTAGREAYRAGHYERGLTTTSGQWTMGAIRKVKVWRPVQRVSPSFTTWMCS